MDERPTINFTSDENKYEENFSKLLEQYPVPEWYNLGDSNTLTEEDIPVGASRRITNLAVDHNMTIANDASSKSKKSRRKSNIKEVY